MLTVIHTFNGPDKERLLADIRTGLGTVEAIEGFKFASINEQQNASDLVVVSKWENRDSFEAWQGSIGENNAYKQATPQVFDILEEKY